MSTRWSISTKINWKIHNCWFIYNAWLRGAWLQIVNKLSSLSKAELSILTINLSSKNFVDWDVEPIYFPDLVDKLIAWEPISEYNYFEYLTDDVWPEYSYLIDLDYCKLYIFYGCTLMKWYDRNIAVENWEIVGLNKDKMFKVVLDLFNLPKNEDEFCEVMWCHIADWTYM